MLLNALLPSSRDEPEVKYLILRLRFVPNMDTTGLVALEDIYHDLERHNCRLILTGLQPEVKQLLERTGLLKQLDYQIVLKQRQMQFALSLLKSKDVLNLSRLI